MLEASSLSWLAIAKIWLMVFLASLSVNLPFFPASEASSNCVAICCASRLFVVPVLFVVLRPSGR